jgi:hypothetical protein
VVVFEDTGELLPDGRAVAPHRARCARWVPAQATRSRTGAPA